MTQPTQAQIEAVKKEYLNRCGHYRPPSDETFAALAAAAQIIEIERELREKAVADTIECCAQVADKLFHSEDARAIAAAIRSKLKNTGESK